MFVSCLSISLLSSSPLYECNNFFILSPVDRHVGCFQFGSIVNSAAINICIQVFLSESQKGYAKGKNSEQKTTHCIISFIYYRRSKLSVRIRISREEIDCQEAQGNLGG